jgi:hypothetical protein
MSEGLTILPCQVNEPVRSEFVAGTNREASNRVDNDHADDTYFSDRNVHVRAMLTIMGKGGFQSDTPDAIYMRSGY